MIREKTTTNTSGGTVEGVEAVHVDRMVAMVSVPPEHVPEGILGLIRSHRPFIEHVRVVIADPDSDDQKDTLKKNNDNNDTTTEEQQQQQQSSMSSSMDVDVEGPADPDKKSRSGRTYLVLFLMASEEDADTFIEDLDGRPYIAFDDQDICSVEKVVGLQGQDGVSLLNPNFAPSMTKKPTGRTLEILPSSSATISAAVVQTLVGGSEDSKTDDGDGGGGIESNIVIIFVAD